MLRMKRLMQGVCDQRWCCPGMRFPQKNRVGRGRGQPINVMFVCWPLRTSSLERDCAVSILPGPGPPSYTAGEQMFAAPIAAAALSFEFHDHPTQSGNQCSAGDITAPK
jgi:hypothetical protein